MRCDAVCHQDQRVLVNLHGAPGRDRQALIRWHGLSVQLHRLLAQAQQATWLSAVIQNRVEGRDARTFQDHVVRRVPSDIGHAPGRVK
jgi:hypothetical protein